jgi:hypothetical protein
MTIKILASSIVIFDTKNNNFVTFDEFVLPKMSDNIYYQEGESEGEYIQLEDVTQSDIDVTTSSEEEPKTNILSIEGTGCIGRIEKLPLWFKLISMSSVLVLGYTILAIYVIVITYRKNQTAASARDFMISINHVNDFIERIQHEREISNHYLCNVSMSDNELQTAWRASDAALVHASSWINTNFVNLTILAGIRENVTLYKDDLITAYQTLLFYTDVIESTLKTVGTASQSVMSDRSIPVVLNSIQYVDAVFKSSAMALFYFYSDFKHSEADYDLFSYDYIRRFLLDAIRYSAPSSTVEQLDAMKLVADIQKMDIFYVLFNKDNYASIRQNYTFSSVLNYTSTYQTITTAVGASILDFFIHEKELEYDSSVAVFTVVTVLIILFTFAALFSNLILSATITGPWRRLNMLQESTIRKFVPQGFLNLIKCRNISDVQLGISAQRNITMMRVEIVNFESWTKEIDTTQVLSLLNHFLGHVCPFIRQHTGFVDKYNHNGFSAIFVSHRAAMKASINIQRYINTLRNSDYNFRDIRVGIALHAAQVRVGTVGENERMEGAVISDETSLNDYLLRVNDKLGTSVIASKSEHRIKNSRSLGKTLDRQSNEIGIIEVFDPSDATKKSTKDIFSEAASCFANKEYYGAKILFSEVLEHDPSDQVCKSFLGLCKTVIAQCDLIMEKIDAFDILKIPSLRVMLEKQCEEEHSSENYQLYELIENFKTLSSVSERRVLAEQIYADYCDINGKHAVNVTDKTKSAIKVKLQDKDYIVTKELLDDLMRQMTSNMMDPAKRLKATQLYKEACLKVIAVDIRSPL